MRITAMGNQKGSVRMAGRKRGPARFAMAVGAMRCAFAVAAITAGCGAARPVKYYQLTVPGDIAYAASEMLGRSLDVDRAGYGLVDTAAETIVIARDWTAPGVASLAGLLHFRDYGSYIDDLRKGVTVAFADARLDSRTRDNAQALHV